MKARHAYGQSQVSARYLLRFDDICPTMNWCIWNQVEAILVAECIKPILAVVPDNQDMNLQVAAPDDHFWDRVRHWQSIGWTIAMHGWQHRYVTQNGGILGVNPYSEFAGLPQGEQRSKLQLGLDVLKREGIDSRVWIAPAHAFDAVTVRALQDLGFRYISDGFALFPHIDAIGMTWVPQQLWSFRRRAFGVWTICFHVNGWSGNEIASFLEGIQRFQGAISSFETIIDCYDGRRKSMADSLAARLYWSLARAKATAAPLTRPFLRSSIRRARHTAL